MNKYTSGDATSKIQLIRGRREYIRYEKPLKSGQKVQILIPDTQAE